MKVLEKFYQIGVEQNMLPQEKRRVRLVNKLVLVGLFSLSLFIFNEINNDLYLSALTSFVSIITLLFSVYLNSLGLINIAPVIALLTLGISNTVNSYFILGSIGNEFIALSLIGLPALTISEKQKKLMIFTMCTLSLLGAFILIFDFKNTGIYRLNENEVYSFYLFSYSQAILIVFAQMLLFHYEFSKRNELLKKTSARFYNQGRMSQISLMSTGLSHEINNPLTMILNSAKLIKKTSDNPSIIRKSDSILRNCDRAFSVIDKISSIYSGKIQEADIHQVDLNDIVENILEDYNKRFGVQNIFIYFDKSPAPLFVDVVISKLRSSIINIINNAIEAMQLSDSKNLKLESYISSDKVILKISDTGIGIQTNYVDDIMTPFFSTKDIGKGSGLGLTLACSSIEAMGGRVYLESTSKDGTTFVIEVPMSNNSKVAA